MVTGSSVASDWLWAGPRVFQFQNERCLKSVNVGDWSFVLSVRDDLQFV